jgi:hypothetical protein
MALPLALRVTFMGEVSWAFLPTTYIQNIFAQQVMFEMCAEMHVYLYMTDFKLNWNEVTCLSKTSQSHIS